MSGWDSTWEKRHGRESSPLFATCKDNFFYKLWVLKIKREGLRHLREGRQVESGVG